LHNAVDEVHTWVENANLQVGRLLNIMNNEEINIPTSLKVCMPPPLGTKPIFNTQFPSSLCSAFSYYSESGGSVDNGESDGVIFE